MAPLPCFANWTTVGREEEGLRDQRALEGRVLSKYQGADSAEFSAWCLKGNEGIEKALKVFLWSVRQNA